MIKNKTKTRTHATRGEKLKTQKLSISFNITPVRRDLAYLFLMT